MRRRHEQSFLRSPVLIGALTTLVVIVAVVLAYKANSGLPFVPVYRVSVEIPNVRPWSPDDRGGWGGRVSQSATVSSTRVDAWLKACWRWPNGGSTAEGAATGGAVTGSVVTDGAAAVGAAADFDAAAAAAA